MDLLNMRIPPYIRIDLFQITVTQSLSAGVFCPRVLDISIILSNIQCVIHTLYIYGHPLDVMSLLECVRTQGFGTHVPILEGQTNYIKCSYGCKKGRKKLEFWEADCGKLFRLIWEVSGSFPLFIHTFPLAKITFETPHLTALIPKCQESCQYSINRWQTHSNTTTEMKEMTFLLIKEFNIYDKKRTSIFKNEITSVAAVFGCENFSRP